MSGKFDIDSLGSRMKEYESVYAQKLLRRMYTIIRIDGQSFKSYTSGLKKPFDKGLVDDMMATAKHLCNVIQGCKLAYVQSDEISLVLTDFESITTQAWFGNELQKMVSISASTATAKFNQLRTFRHIQDLGSYYFNQASAATQIIDDFSKLKQAAFDSRVYQLPNFTEVGNYLRWRQQDCVRNSVSGVAQSLYSHNQLHGKDTEAKQELIFQKGGKLINNLVNCGYTPVVNILNPCAEFKRKDNFNWNDVPPHLKRGTTISKQLIKKYYSNEVYEKDKRPEKIKLNDGWNVEMQTPGEFDYFKMVDEWTPSPVDYSKAFEFLVPVLKPQSYKDEVTS